MFKVTRSGDQRIDVDFTGKLDSEAMRVALDELIQAAEGIEHGKMFHRVGSFEWPTLGAVGVELKRIPQLLRLIRQFDRVAVVADQQWLRTASEVEGALIPGLTIKAFDSIHEAQAEAWLQQ
ncbi:SpoIIAA family protein [Ectopseudomonas hydrolytica]|uniref:STAS/SEC14 domain-containing protein n=1 Tax=Ectopseudomonas hydrolytica TaxID=2493633 RepID=UPI00376F2806